MRVPRRGPIVGRRSETDDEKVLPVSREFGRVI